MDTIATALTLLVLALALALLVSSVAIRYGVHVAALQMQQAASLHRWPKHQAQCPWGQSRVLHGAGDGLRVAMHLRGCTRTRWGLIPTALGAHPVFPHT